jgi:hypothetical protein
MVYCAATGSQYQFYMKLCLPTQYAIPIQYAISNNDNDRRSQIAQMQMAVAKVPAGVLLLFVYACIACSYRIAAISARVSIEDI